MTVTAKMVQHARTECVLAMSAIVMMASVDVTAKPQTKTSVNTDHAMFSLTARTR